MKTVFYPHCQLISLVFKSFNTLLWSGTGFCLAFGAFHLKHQR